MQQGTLQLFFKAAVEPIGSSVGVGASDFTVTPSEIPAGTTPPYDFVIGIGTDDLAIVYATLGGD